MSPYTHGKVALLAKLGLDADGFADLAQEDDTEESLEKKVPTLMAKGVDSSPAWGGQSSLESGDAGTRNHQLGLPRSGAV